MESLTQSFSHCSQHSLELHDENFAKSYHSSGEFSGLTVPDIDKGNMYLNSIYMILNDNSHSNGNMNDTILKPSNCDNFHHIRSYGFTGKENPPVKHNNIALFFTGIIYNLHEIVDNCIADILKEKQNLHNTKQLHQDMKSYERMDNNNITIEVNKDGEDGEDDYRLSFDDTTTHIEDCKNLLKNPYELIIYLYNNYGIDYTLQLLDGEFAFILVDDDLQELHTSLYIVRDRMGIQPMYIFTEKLKKSQPISRNMTVREQPLVKANVAKIYGFATDLSFLSDNIDSTDEKYSIMSFPPGTYSKYTLPFKVLSSWRLNQEYVKYYTPISTSLILEKSKFLIKTQLNNTIRYLQTKLINSVTKKWNLCKQDNKIVCLLSGGIDSSVIAAIIGEIVRKHNLEIPMHNTLVPVNLCSGLRPSERHEALKVETPKGSPTRIEVKNFVPKMVFETYCIGFKNSDDIRYARMVAEKIGSIHHEIIITEKEYIDTIPFVIQILETYDTATVRAGVAQYLLCKHISKTTDCKNILTGDGADELMGGYMYMHSAHNMIEFDRESQSLIHNYHHNYGRLRNIYKFFGLTNHSPFLEQQFINYYLSIPLELRYPHWFNDHLKNFREYFLKINTIEKYLLRLAFSKDYYVTYDYSTIFPEEIIWRPKEDFFDGISNYPNSTRHMILRQLQWYESNNPRKNDKFTKEQQYYFDIFEHFYNINISIHCWRLKYIKPTEEPSAHILDNYFDYNPEYQDRSL